MPSSGYRKLRNEAAEFAAACIAGCNWLLGVFQEGFNTSKLGGAGGLAVMPGPFRPMLSILSLHKLVGRYTE